MIEELTAIEVADKIEALAELAFMEDTIVIYPPELIALAAAYLRTMHRVIGNGGEELLRKQP